MDVMKKIEIITDSLELEKIFSILDREGISGYTVIRDVVGKGRRGVRRGDLLTDAMNNSYIITVCPEEKVASIVKSLRPILKKFGGVCVICDCQLMTHQSIS